MADIYGHLSILVKLWETAPRPPNLHENRKWPPIFMGIDAARQHADAIRHIPADPKLRTPDQQEAWSKAEAFYSKHMADLVKRVQGTNPKAVDVLRDAISKRASEWEATKSWSTTANEQFLLLHVNTAQSLGAWLGGWVGLGSQTWESSQKALTDAYQEMALQKKQIDRTAADEFTPLLDQGSLLGVLDIDKGRSGTLPMRFLSATDALDNQATALLQGRLTALIGSAQKVMADSSTFLDGPKNATGRPSNTTNQALAAWAKSPSPGELGRKIPSLQTHVLAVQVSFDAAQDQPTPPMRFTERVRLLKDFRNSVEDLEKSTTSSIKDMLYQTESTIKANCQRQIQEALKKLHPLLVEFPSNETLLALQKRLEDLGSGPTSPLNKRMTPTFVEVSGLQKQLNAFSALEDEIVGQVNTVVQQTMTELDSFLQLKEAESRENQGKISSDINALQNRIGEHLAQLQTSPLDSPYSEKLEGLQKQIADLEARQRETAPNDFAKQNLIHQEFIACRKAVDAIEKLIYRDLRAHLQAVCREKIEIPSKQILEYLDLSKRVLNEPAFRGSDRNGKMRVLREKIKTCLTELGQASDQANPVSNWGEYHQRLAAFREVVQKKQTQFAELKQESNFEWGALLENHSGLNEQQLSSLHQRKFHREGDVVPVVPGRERSAPGASAKPELPTLTLKSSQKPVEMDVLRSEPKPYTPSRTSVRQPTSDVTRQPSPVRPQPILNSRAALKSRMAAAANPGLSTDSSEPKPVETQRVTQARPTDTSAKTREMKAAASQLGKSQQKTRIPLKERLQNLTPDGKNALLAKRKLEHTKASEESQNLGSPPTDPKGARG